MKNKKLKFSVLMTVYYKENPLYLEQALNSIENQTIIPNEIVIVKDGKLTPKLDDVIDYHSKQNKIYKIISLKENHGRGYASNIGMKNVSNDWVARMDSDDVCMLNRFENQIKAIIDNQQNYNKLAAVGGQIEEFNDTGKIVGKRVVPISPDEIRKYAEYRSPMNNPTVMINKTCINQIGSYSTLNVLEDYDLWIRLIANNYILINIPNVLVKMRVGNGMYSRRGGFEYFKTYVSQKYKWKRLGIGTNVSVIISCLSMLVSILIPASVRKILYTNFLHK